MDIKSIRRLVKSKRYQIKLHAVLHALKEGFNEQDIVEAILSGKIIESYSERQRVLICGKVMLESEYAIYLHVICGQNYPDQVEIVTAYIPDELTWEKPPLKRRRRRKRK